MRAESKNGLYWYSSDLQNIILDLFTQGLENWCVWLPFFVSLNSATVQPFISNLVYLPFHSPDWSLNTQRPAASQFLTAWAVNILRVSETFCAVCRVVFHLLWKGARTFALAWSSVCPDLSSLYSLLHSRTEQTWQNWMQMLLLILVLIVCQSCSFGFVNM